MKHFSKNLFIDDAAKMIMQKEFVGGVIFYVLAVFFVYVILGLMAGV